jgi:hypothetical protein
MNPLERKTRQSIGPEEEERKIGMKMYRKMSLSIAALAMLSFAGSVLHGDDGKHSETRWKQLVVDVAVDARTAVVNLVKPADPLPERGATFIENGKVYPGGTIPPGNGLDIDSLTGSIGTFVNRGTFNFDLGQVFAGAHPAISSAQQYVFSQTGALDAEDSLMSEGQDSVNTTTRRVVLGGTGIYRGTIGEVKQEVLGANSTGFLNFRFTFTIRTSE